jgi:hypothetical protein
MLLSEIKSVNFNTRSYNLAFTIQLPNSTNANANIASLTGFEIYDLLEEQNKELIEKIVILNETDNEADICILLNHIAKEVGIKQKYMLFRSTKIVNKLNNSITFYSKDVKLICKQLKEDYLKQLNLINSDYEALIYNYGKTQINFYKDIKDSNEINSVKVNIDFQVIVDDDLPLYMENLVGLMFKKMFYNLKNYFISAS